MDLKLNDKIIVVSGASKGIGKACTELFLEEGAKVIAIARDTSAIQQTDRLIPFCIDVSQKEEIEKFKSLISTRFPIIDVLINNVGSNIRKETLAYDDEDFNRLMNVNIKSAYNLSRVLFPMIKNSGGGSVINVSSVASKRSFKTSTLVYAMTKAAMNQMTEFLAMEWGQYNIRVNAILPWYINTALVKSVLEDPKKLKSIEEKTPLGRVGEPQEVANVIAFLASEKSSYVSGALIPVDGGFLTN
ncbi:SDR family oxidoreductase [Hyphobacterium sp. CCMP332]|nr:SDR family oxidoreductase [Hyphobacterium sp. CCMP332]